MTYAYTTLNLWAVAAALIVRQPIISEIVFVNSVAICTSFHCGLLLDWTAYDRLCQFNRCNRLTLASLNFSSHILPPIVMWYTVSNRDIDRISGSISLIMHLLWVYVACGSFNLSDIYIKMHWFHWCVMWFVAIGTHLYVPVLM